MKFSDIQRFKLGQTAVAFIALLLILGGMFSLWNKKRTSPRVENTSTNTAPSLEASNVEVMNPHMILNSIPSTAMLSRAWNTQGELSPDKHTNMTSMSAPTSITTTKLALPRIIIPYTQPTGMMSPSAPPAIESPVITNFSSQPPDSTSELIAYTYINKHVMLSKSPESFSEAWITYRKHRRAPPPETTRIPTSSNAASFTPPSIAPDESPDPESVAKAMYLVREAEQKKETGNLAEAIDLYRKALARFPHMTFAHHQIGRIYFMQGNYDKAISHLTSALDANENLAEIFSELGTAYLYAGKNEDALTCFISGMKTEPDNPELMFNVGLVYRRLHRLDESRDTFRQYLEGTPSDARAYRELAVLDLIQTNQTSAIAYLDRAMEIDPAWYPPRLDAALIHAKLRHHSEAIRHLEQALEIAPYWVVFQVYQQSAFNDIRLMPEFQSFQTRLVEKARKQM